MEKFICILVLSLLSTAPTHAQNPTPKPLQWGLEAELVQPFIPTVSILHLLATRRVTPDHDRLRGDALLGMYIRPNVAHDVVEKINEYMVVLGYRQYLWKGLHVEVRANAGYAWGTRNLIDERDYETPTLFWEANLGYRVYLTPGTTRLYLAPQVGALGNIVGDIGPRGGKPDNFFNANLALGVNF